MEDQTVFRCHFFPSPQHYFPIYMSMVASSQRRRVFWSRNSMYDHEQVLQFSLRLQAARLILRGNSISLPARHITLVYPGESQRMDFEFKHFRRLCWRGGRDNFLREGYTPSVLVEVFVNCFETPYRTYPNATTFSRGIKIGCTSL